MKIIKPPDDVLVALSHLDLVLQALDDAGGNERIYDKKDIDRSDELGLAKIKLRQVDRAAELIETWVDAAAAEHAPTGEPLETFNDHRRPDPKSRPLDFVLWALRAGIGVRNAGWFPELGKNRLIGRVPGAEKRDPSAHSDIDGAGDAISHGGGGAPRSIAEGGTATSEPPFTIRDRTPDSDGYGVRIGIVDTGIDNNAALAGSWTGRGSLLGPVKPDEARLAEAGHATFIAGLMLRRAPGVEFSVHKVLGDDGGAKHSWEVAKGIAQISRTGIHILNISFVTYVDVDDKGNFAGGVPEVPFVLAAALKQVPPETVVVAAAGNHGFLDGDDARKPAYPAACAEVLSVGAAEAGTERPAPFTPRGPWVDVLARGTGLRSTYLTGPVAVWNDVDGKRDPEPVNFDGFAEWDGSSFSSALVCAEIAARMKEGRTAREAREAMLAEARADAQASQAADGRPPYVNVHFDC